ncbi:MAG: hypothetical protein LBN27_06675 [Prevotellaceae bacterium]|jgi:hypothetical protein|nr:hypothetical protein [Prevotellaceae bacterium]
METAVKTQRRRNAISKGTVKICSHLIEWWLDGKGLALSDMDKEYICNSLINNYVEGELCAITPQNQIVAGRWNMADLY